MQSRNVVEGSAIQNESITIVNSLRLDLARLVAAIGRAWIDGLVEHGSCQYRTCGYAERSRDGGSGP